MKIAHEFGRPDVDPFLDEIDADQFEEWVSYFATEPTGWDAIRIATTRLSYVIAQTQSRKKLKERDFDIRLGITSPETERARLEAFKIQQQTAALHARKKKRRRTT